MYWSLENVPWTNLHDLNLDWIINTMKQTVEQWIAYRLEMNQKYQDFTDNIELWKTEIETNFSDLQQYVQDYFDNLDLNESTRYVINQMIASGEFIEVLNPSIVTAVENWLTEHITPTTPAVDDTLSVSGAAADAKTTGDKLENRYNEIVKNGQIISMPSIWEIGTINVGTGVNVPNAQNPPTNRMRVVVKTSLSGIYQIKTNTNYEFILYCYADNDVYLGVWTGSNFDTQNYHWLNNIFISQLPSIVKNIRLVLHTANNTDISQVDTENVLFYIPSKENVYKNSEIMKNIIATKNDNYTTIIEYNLDSMRIGAIDATGINTETTTYYNNSYRSIGFHEVYPSATEIIVNVTEATSTNFYTYLYFYNQNFTFLSRIGGRHQTLVESNIPENAHYFRISLTQITTEELGIDNITYYKTRQVIPNVINTTPKNKWYILGDSISAGYYSMTESMADAAGTPLTYISPVTTEDGETTGSVWNRSLEHTYWKYANDWYLHKELVPMAYPGQGYLRKASNDQNGIDVIRNSTFEDGSLITVAFGFNDWHYNQPRGDHTIIDTNTPYPTENFDITLITTVNQAIWYCLGELIRKSPNSTIVVQTPFNAWAYGGDWSTDWSINYQLSNSDTLKDIHDDIVYWCNYYGLQILEMTFNNSTVNRRNIKSTIIDGSHPSDAAHKQLARYVAIALKNI